MQRNAVKCRGMQRNAKNTGKFREMPSQFHQPTCFSSEAGNLSKKCREMLRNAENTEKFREMQRNAKECREMQRNAEK